MWSSMHREDEEEGAELSSGHMKNSINRTGMGDWEVFDDWLIMNSRQNSAVFFEGHNRHLSPDLPNFFSHIPAS